MTDKDDVLIQDVTSQDDVTNQDNVTSQDDVTSQNNTSLEIDDLTKDSVPVKVDSPIQENFPEKIEVQNKVEISKPVNNQKDIDFLKEDETKAINTIQPTAVSRNCFIWLIFKEIYWHEAHQHFEAENCLENHHFQEVKMPPHTLKKL